MRLIIFGTVSLLLYFVYGFYLSQASFSVVPDAISSHNFSKFYDYRGVMNVHTQLSLGSSSPTEVVDEAKQADLDFLILTDVNQFEHVESMNGYHGNLLVMNEAEYSFLDSRVLYVSDEQLLSPQDASLALTDLLSQTNPESRGPLAVLAHPFNSGPTWTGDLPRGYDGIEILNLKSIASKAWKRSKIDVLWSLFIYPFSSQYAFLRLFREPDDEIALWDSENNKRPLWGFGGADASARAIPFTNYLIKFPSYLTSFQIVNNHVLLESELTGNYLSDRKKILSAMKSGRFYVSLDLLGNPKGFYAHLSDKDHEWPMGSRVPLSPSLRLIAGLATQPKYYYEIVVYKNGERITSTNDPYFEVAIREPGAYRVIVRVSPTLPLPDGTRWMTWIYSNPFVVTGSGIKK